MKTTIGLVLSGGGYRGIAHAGAIKAFEDFGILPSHISGTSAGALVGALYAADYSPEEILNIFKKVRIFDLTRFALKKPGWVDTDTFHSFLSSYFPRDNFKALSKKLFVSTTDLLNGRTTIFSEGKLIEALLASASIPGIFSPVNINDGLYSDGGILDNFPITPVIKCEAIYGVYVSPINKMKRSQFKHSYDVINRAFHLRMHKTSTAKFSKCNLVIYPNELANYTLFNSKNADEFFEIGYRNTYDALIRKYAEKQFIKK